MSPSDPAAAIRARIEERLAAHDRAGAISAGVDAATSGEISVVDLNEHVLAPLLVETGAEWQSGEREVWEEHYATAVVRTIVEALAPTVTAQAPEPNGAVVVLACPSEEYHDLGLRMLADRFALAGWRVHLLGADTPLVELVKAARQLAADLVVLSVATHYHRLRLRPYVDMLAHELPDVAIRVGGAAFAHTTEGWSERELLTDADIAEPPVVGA